MLIFLTQCHSYLQCITLNKLQFNNIQLLNKQCKIKTNQYPIHKVKWLIQIWVKIQ